MKHKERKNVSRRRKTTTRHIEEKSNTSCEYFYYIKEKTFEQAGLIQHIKELAYQSINIRDRQLFEKYYSN